MLPPTARVLARLLAKLPGVGERTATRYVMHLLASDPTLSRAIADTMQVLHERVRPCASCGAPAEIDPAAFDAQVDDPSGSIETHAAAPVRCAICSDPRRDPTLLCVVARVPDLAAIERSGAMRGRYFVLGKLVSPLDGIGPEDLPIGRLRARIEEDEVREVILATPPSVDGEATSLLLSQELSALGIAVSRIASGVPHGSDIELADQVTIGRAITGRRGL